MASTTHPAFAERRLRNAGDAAAAFRRSEAGQRHPLPRAPASTIPSGKPGRTAQRVGHARQAGQHFHAVKERVAPGAFGQLVDETL